MEKKTGKADMLPNWTHHMYFLTIQTHNVLSLINRNKNIYSQDETKVSK